MPQPSQGPRPSVLAAVFLISVAALALQVVQMRIFAFSLWHHLAFLVISIAILGFGASGALTASFPRLRPPTAGNALAVAGIGFAVTPLLGAWVLAMNPIDVFSQIGTGEILQVGLYYLIFALPYFFAGYMISLTLVREAAHVSRVYSVNLLGSGAGCFLIFATLVPLGADGSLLLISALGASTAFIVAEQPQLRWSGFGLALLLLALLPVSSTIVPVRAAESKFFTRVMENPNMELGFSTWTPFARIDVVENASLPYWVVFQDGDAPTLMPRSAKPMPPSDARSIPYHFVSEPRVLIIGAGAGMDVKVAVDRGAKHVTAVELNPITYELSRNPEFNTSAALNNGDPRVDLQVSEGRYFVRSSEAVYDLIQMTGVDTYTALASGAYVLSESFLYTKEAFHDYLDHLSDRGMISILRFSFPAPRETLRVLVMAAHVLRERGVAEPWKHVVVLRHTSGGSGVLTTTTSMGTILIRKTAFDDALLDRVRAFAKKYGFVRDFVPDEEGRFTDEELVQLEELVAGSPALQDYRVNAEGMNPFYSYREALIEEREEEFFAAYPYDVRPVSDDSPYFFNQHRLSSVWEWLTGQGGEIVREEQLLWAPMTFLFQTKPVGLILLFLTLAQLAVLASLCIFLPLFAFRREGVRAANGPLILLYFACLGVAYILLQISAMQRFGLILGHPVYGMTIVMASFLIASGVGSLLSARFSPVRAARVLLIVATVLVAAAASYQALLPSLTQLVLLQPFPVRAAVVVALIAPMGVFMGMCFPTGIRVLAGGNEAVVAWAYGVNGAASVLGSVMAVWLAMGLGFVAVQWIASSLYVVAALLMALLVRAVLRGSGSETHA